MESQRIRALKSDLRAFRKEVVPVLLLFPWYAFCTPNCCGCTHWFDHLSCGCFFFIMPSGYLLYSYLLIIREVWNMDPTVDFNYHENGCGIIGAEWGTWENITKHEKFDRVETCQCWDKYSYRFTFLEREGNDSYMSGEEFHVRGDVVPYQCEGCDNKWRHPQWKIRKDEFTGNNTTYWWTSKDDPPTPGRFAMGFNVTENSTTSCWEAADLSPRQELVYKCDSVPGRHCNQLQDPGILAAEFEEETIPQVWRYSYSMSFIFSVGCIFMFKALASIHISYRMYQEGDTCGRQLCCADDKDNTYSCCKWCCLQCAENSTNLVEFPPAVTPGANLQAPKPEQMPGTDANSNQAAGSDAAPGAEQPAPLVELVLPKAKPKPKASTKKSAATSSKPLRPGKTAPVWKDIKAAERVPPGAYDLKI